MRTLRQCHWRGLRTGVCLRPQLFTFGVNGTASQVFLTGNAAIIANLEAKARYANSRWGTTLFYVDSTVDVNGGTLDPAIFQQLITDLPTFLFIPEESTPRYYAYSAPFYSFIFQGSLGTPSSTYNYYPRAFGANLVNDVAAASLATYTPQLTQSVRDGDILMGHADFWQANDPTLVSIYQAAGVTAPPPTQVTPAVTWANPASINYGTPLSSRQLDAVASVPGTYVYTPALGTILTAGNQTLMVSFTPTDSTDYKSTTASVILNVTKVAPLLSWPTPASMNAGTLLSSLQLNASASVPGTFSYSPAAGTVPSVGTDMLTVTFTPADTVDFSTTSATTNLVVTAPPLLRPVITWNSPAAVLYGTKLSTVQLNATAAVAGAFVYSPAAGTVLGAGNNTLQVTFHPNNVANYATVTQTITLVVKKASPTVRWSNPAPIVFGTALTQAQLNAIAQVPGTFVYTPAAGTVPAVGNTTLSVTFTPTDIADYNVQTARVPLTINPAPAKLTLRPRN